VRVKIDPQTGCITSLVNKADAQDAIAPGGCGNLLQTFVDKPLRQDAWEIRFDQEHWDLKQPEEVKLIESGPVRAVIRVKNKFQSSSFVQDIILYAGIPRVDVEMQVEWHEQHVLLKVGVPVSVQTEVATYEIPFGTIQRPTTRRTPAEQAKFEVPALRWGDLSDANHGFSLLNASKYGYDAKDNVIRLSLLRAATYPGAGAECCTDQGHHEFTYSLYAHAGNWDAGGTTQQAYELNFPLIALAAGNHSGTLPAKHSFVQIEPRNVILTAAKKAEDDDGLIIRFYESSGRASQVKLGLPAKAVGAFETNLMEKQERPLPLEGNGSGIRLSIGAYEIKTVKVLFAKSKE
jgi:alpha-mannosidase